MSISVASPKPMTACSRAAVAYLTSTDQQIRNDAFEHLKAIVLKATSGLYIPESEKYPGDSARYSFAEDFLLLELHPYLEMPEEMIRHAAREDKFRYLARRFKQRLLNKIRDTARKNRKYKHERYNDAWADHQSVDPNNEPGFDEDGVWSALPSIGPEEFDRYLGQFDFLSDTDISVATAIFDLRKETARGALPKALAIRFSITVQTARCRVRNLRAKMNAALKAGNTDVKQLFERLNAYVRTADVMLRNEPWPDDPDARQYSIQMTPFDDASHFGYHQYQDMEHHERDWNFTALTESSRGYSWSQRDALSRAGKIS